jgi:hypothetical protein
MAVSRTLWQRQKVQTLLRIKRSADNALRTTLRKPATLSVSQAVDIEQNSVVIDLNFVQEIAVAAEERVGAHITL